MKLKLRSSELIDGITYKLKPVKPEVFSRSRLKGGANIEEILSPGKSKLIPRIVEGIQKQEDTASRLSYTSLVFNQAYSFDTNALYSSEIIRNFRGISPPFTVGELVSESNVNTIMLADGLDAMFVALCALRAAGVPAHPGGTVRMTFKHHSATYSFNLMMTAVEDDGEIFAAPVGSETEPAKLFEILDDLETLGLANILIALDTVKAVRLDLQCSMYEIEEKIERFASSVRMADQLWENNLFSTAAKSNLKLVLGEYLTPQMAEHYLRCIEYANSEF